MALTAAQIVTLAVEGADLPGFITQGQQLLNMILQDLCHDYDLVPPRKTLSFNLPTAVNSLGQATMVLPADYLRARKNECIYYNSGVPYPLIPIDLDQMDALVTTPGFANFPVYFTTQTETSPVTAIFWPPPSGSFPAIIRYQSLMPDITDFSQVPWFPNQNYLVTRLTGELCKIEDDDRAQSLLTDNVEVSAGGAGVILRHFLQMHDDMSNRVKTVTLDRRQFGNSFDRLRNTKRIGW